MQSVNQKEFGHLFVYGYGVELKTGKVRERGDEVKMWWRKRINTGIQHMAQGLEDETDEELKKEEDRNSLMDGCMMVK